MTELAGLADESLGLFENLRIQWQRTRWGAELLLTGTGPSLEEYYNLMSLWDVTLDSSNRGWINLGYWKDAPTSLSAACRAMAQLLAERAQISSDHDVLDVGCGHGNFARFLVDTRQARSVLGLNILSNQVALAQNALRGTPYEGRVRIMQGDAVALTLPDESVDRVTALECAFHFDTRKKFFESAYRCLRRGGRIATADILPSMVLPSNPLTQKFCSAGLVPIENWQVDIATYRRQLEALGYRDVEVLDITPHVFAPFSRHMLKRADMETIVRFFREERGMSTPDAIKHSRQWTGYLYFVRLNHWFARYVIATATK